MTDEGMELGWRRECADTDNLLRALGLNPERCRTDGGWLNVQRVLTLLGEQRAALVPAVNNAIQEAIRAAQKPRPSSVAPPNPQWDDGYLNGIKVCGTVVQAAMRLHPEHTQPGVG